MKEKNRIELIGLRNIPLIKEGDDISQYIIDAANESEISLKDGDILLIAQIIISKSLGLIKRLGNINASEKANRIYEKLKKKAEENNLPQKEPELIQAILDESKKIIKSEHVLITETKHGFICADAGIDKSNVGVSDLISFLPKNPDKEAEKIRKTLENKINKQIAVIITDSFGRPFRVGSVGVAIGISGISALLDKRGYKDLYNKELKSTIIGQVDNLACAAQLIMGESNEGFPVVLIRGYDVDIIEDVSINSILREKEKDIFRKTDERIINEILKSRRSYKLSFQDRSVSFDIIKHCIDIARWAPSAHNGQFWRYIILKKGSRKKLIDKMNQKLRKDLEKDNRSPQFIEKKIKKTRKSFLKAPILILLCLDRSDLEKYPDEKRTYNEYLLGVQSISASAIYFLLAAESKGLAASWYCAPLFAKEIVKKVLNLPQKFDPMAFFAMGYPKEIQKTPKRKSLDNIIYKIE